MKPIAIWLHCRLSGAGIDTGHAVGILLEQLAAMQHSRLLSAADSFNVGVSDLDHALASQIILPSMPGAKWHLFDAEKRGELPTLCALREWVKSAASCYVCYSHLKCATRKDALCRAWRRCMTRYLLELWPVCVQTLENGADSAGCHWLTPREYPRLVKSPYWGGNHWWAKSSFLATLPPLPDHADSRETFFLAEKWIGSGSTAPRIRDFHAAWPSMACEARFAGNLVRRR